MSEARNRGCAPGGHAPDGLRLAALVKQIPRFESMDLTLDGRLVRTGVDLEMSAYCRRAVSKGAELARQTGGSLTAFTLGPAAAEDVLREALACGADSAVHLTDPAFAGSDTLATARALAAAIAREGPFDLILCGRNSVDADTGQVGPEVAEMLDLPFLCAVRNLALEDRCVRARCEGDDGWIHAEMALPGVISVAERLCAPAKAPPEARAAVAAERIRRLHAADLGAGPWGLEGSPTRVGALRSVAPPRSPRVLSGPVPAQVSEAVALLRARGAFDAERPPNPGTVPDAGPPGGPVLAVVVEPGRERLARELLGAGARLARVVEGRVSALVTGLAEPADADALASWGADRVVVLRGGPHPVEEDVARATAAWAQETRPWALIAPGTLWGREIAGRVAARLGAGLTGDAIDLAVEHGRLVASKPAFGGRLVAAITAASTLQMATVRPGVLPLPRPRVATARVDIAPLHPRGRVRVTDRTREDDVEALNTAAFVIGVGTGVPPAEYPRLDRLRRVLGAELAATRKVTDQGWLPRARQVGITGHSISPRLYVAIGIGGKYNHTVGIRNAHSVLSINRDPDALIHRAADVAIVGDWREAVELLADRIARDTARAPAGF